MSTHKNTPILGKVLAMSSKKTGATAQQIYRLHVDGVSYTSLQKEGQALKWRTVSHTEIPLPTGLMTLILKNRLEN